MIKRALFIGLIVVSLLVTPAGAVRRSDPDDIRPPVDIGLTRFTEPDEGIAQATIVTYESWGCGHFGQGSRNKLKWLFDGRGDRRFDLVGEFFCRRKVLLFELRSKDGTNRYESLRVRRRGDSRTALVRFPMDLMELRGDDISMIARYKGVDWEDCEIRGDCTDRAPDSGRMTFQE